MQLTSRNIKKENYLILMGVIVITILLVLLFTYFNNIYKVNRIKKSPLANVVTVKKEDKLSSISDKDYFLMISETNNQEIYDLEKEIDDILKENKLTKKFYYLDITKDKDDADLINRLNGKLGLDSIRLISVPAIIYFRDNKAVNIISSNYGLPFKSGDFYQVLDIYELTKK